MSSANQTMSHIASRPTCLDIYTKEDLRAATNNAVNIAVTEPNKLTFLQTFKYNEVDNVKYLRNLFRVILMKRP